MAARCRWKMVLPTATLTVFPFAMYGPTAAAFFPPISPPPPVVGVVVSPPVVPPVTVVPPVSPPPFVVEPPVGPPPVVVTPTCECPGSTIPEPSSMVAGIAGLSTAAGWAMRRRWKKPGSEVA